MQQVSSDIVLVRVYQPEALADLRRQFREAIASFPEYCDGADRSILGGFGAFGVPSSFHGAFARQLRQAVNGPGERGLHSLMAPDEYIHQLYDRIRYRPAGVTFSGESWHRDVASSHLSILPDDAIYGGFVNFNDYPVHFTCVPGSSLRHGDATSTGFARAEKPTPERVRVLEVSPGWMILFRQSILHCVTQSTSPPDGDYRQFAGFRVTRSFDPAYDVNTIVATLTTPRLPSGQWPRLYPSTYPNFYPEKLRIWANQNIREDFFEWRKIKNVPTFSLPHYIKRGLVDANMASETFKYSEEDHLLLLPHLNPF